MRLYSDGALGVLEQLGLPALILDRLDRVVTMTDIWRGLVPQFQRGKPMPRHIARGDARRARIRSRVEHVFAAQKRRFDLVIRTIGLARATAKLALANIAYNFTRLAWIESSTVA